MTLYDIEVTTIDGQPQTLDAFKGDVLLIVNVASRCGFTPQYAGLEATFRKYAKQGFKVLGFPCNQFGQQEPGTEAQIKAFCSSNYNVSFPMFAKIDVNGPGEHDLYRELKAASGSNAEIKWNFEKFLVKRDGSVVRFGSNETPEALSGAIEDALG